MEKDFIKNVMYMAVGYASMNKEKIEEFTKSLTEKGKMTEEEGRKMVNDLVERSKELKHDIENKISEVSKEVYDKLHLATKDELDKLKKKIEELETRIK